MQRVSFDRVDFFLGATTPAGFKGYFEPLRREPGMQMVLIKKRAGLRQVHPDEAAGPPGHPAG